MAGRYVIPDDPEYRARNRQQAWFWGSVFVIFFLVTFFANGMLAYLALGTWTGLTSEHAYDDGIHYNRALAGARQMAARGWHVAINFTAGVNHSGDLAVSLKDRNGAPLTDATVTALFLRPTSEGHDVTTALAPDAGDPGHYTGHVALPWPGVYDVHVTARLPSGDYQGAKRIWAP